MPKVLIRRLTIEDALTSFHWRNDPDVWIYTGNRPNRVITREIEENWLTEKLIEKNSLRFAIIADDKYVGNIQITDIKEGDNGQYQIFIGDKKFWGKGIATLATAQIIRVAKYELNLRNLYLVVNRDNKAAIKVYEKNGFIKIDQEIRMSLDLNHSPLPSVSVFIMAYNHEKFIAQALEGILMQKTNFDFDIVIGEDCSSDNTRSIVLEYANKYPGKFNLVLHKSNVGAIKNQLAVFQSCTGNYIAICEGDDYWTDQNKLQKQVDFLEQNSDYVMHCHNAMIIYENNLVDEHLFNLQQQKQTLDFSDIVREWRIPSASILFRSSSLQRIPDWFSDIYNGDYAIGLLLSEKGKVKYSEEIMSVYRKQFGALSFNPKINSEFNTLQLIKLFTYLNEETKFKYDDLIRPRIESIRKAHNKIKKKRQYPLLYPKYLLKKVLKIAGISVFTNPGKGFYTYKLVRINKYRK